MKLGSNELPQGDYGAALESFYDDLVLNERAGRISNATHQALEDFLQELRELVSEEKTAQLLKAA